MTNHAPRRGMPRRGQKKAPWPFAVQWWTSVGAGGMKRGANLATPFGVIQRLAAFFDFRGTRQIEILKREKTRASSLHRVEIKQGRGALL